MGATSCYIRTGIYKNKNELPLYKRVSTVNGYSIIKHMITIFDTRYTSYEIEGLDSDLLVSYNLLKKIGAVIHTDKEVIKYNENEEKLNYNKGNLLNQHSLTEDNTILPLKEFILKQRRML